MNSIRNNVQLIGRLGAKADFKTVKGDTPMVKLNLATNEVYKTAKERK